MKSCAPLAAVVPALLLLAGAPRPAHSAGLPSWCSGADACAASSGHDHVLLQVAPSQQALAGFTDLRTDAEGQDGPVDDQAFVSVQRRRRAGEMGACRRRHSTASENPPEEAAAEWQCQGNAMVRVGPGAGEPSAAGEAPEETPAPGSPESPEVPEDAGSSGAPGAPKAPATGGCDSSSLASGAGACLCVFDVDRTLTGKQGDTAACGRNKVLDFEDNAYGGGQATLSELSVEGIAKTFCNECYLGITSAGPGSGAGSEWNNYMLDHIMKGEVHDSFMQAHPQARAWSYGTDVVSPFVLNQGNKVKQESVELVRQWYGRNGVCVSPGDVYFFDDRTENIEPFGEKGLNSREISCGSRDKELDGGNGMIGFCGARPEEIQKVKGNVLCE